MEKILHILVQFFELGILIYCLAVMSSYVFIGLASVRDIARYRRTRYLTDYSALLSSPLLPSISVIAPAYNEGLTIVDNIRSLLSLHYGNLSIIIVNDGSTDDTLQKAIEAYELELVPYQYDEQIATQPLRGIYRSRKRAFAKLMVVDKENGGKADALNAGINVSNTDYIASIDVDCIIEQEALLKAIKPVMEADERRVIAVGGIVWLANGSVVKHGKLMELKLPPNYAPRMQAIEYFRVFLLGRTAWAKYNGLLLISGAFGLFDRDIVLEVGGYSRKTVGEDMELVMRMHRHMREQKRPYRIGYVPEPLCWTEAPPDFTILGRQRNRWARGSGESLWAHRRMLLNPRYGILGLLSYPYWLLFEWLGPMIEAAGLLFFLLLVLLGLVDWPFFLALLALVYAYAVFISMFTLFVQEFSYHKYKKVSEILSLAWTLALEPIFYHPRTMLWSLKGNWQLIRGKNKTWGEMRRTGFGGGERGA